MFKRKKERNIFLCLIYLDIEIFKIQLNIKLEELVFKLRTIEKFNNCRFILFSVGAKDAISAHESRVESG